jgi:hypothetical protein
MMPPDDATGKMICQKCGGTGWYAYDHNHSKICEQCCLHNQDVWQLLKHYGDDNGKWCCKVGCGTTWNSVEDYRKEIAS